MNYQTLVKLQKEYGAWEMQEMINSGNAWKMEGSYGRAAMESLRSGACYLPKKSTRDYYGSYIPSRDEVKKGSKGSWQNSVDFYENVHEYF